MEQIVVYKKNGTSFNLMRKDPSCTVTTAVQNLSYMSDDYVQLTIKSTEELNFSYGDKIIVYGREYWLRSEVSVERSGEDLFVYDAQFMGVLYELLKSQYRNTDVNGYAPSSAFDLTGTLLDFIRLIPFNTDRDFAGLWTFDEASCPETEALTLSFSKENCLAVLQRVVKEFDQEFIVEQKNGIRTIKIGKFGQVINPPSGNPYFEYGKGKGLYNLKLQKVDDRSLITRLWVEGGTNNIKSDYRGYSQRLQLPLSKIGNENRRYVEDTELKQKLGDSIEDTEFFDEIFPKRLGTVTGIDSDILSFFDSTMDFNLNEKDAQGNTKWLIDGVSAKIIFNSGALAGQEFELSKYDHSTKKFTIIEFTDSRGLKFPNPDSEAFRIREGDTYKITDIILPDQYVTNAENELWDAAVEKLNDRKQPRVQYVQTFDKTYFSNYLPTDAIANVFMPGDFVPVKDERIGVEKNIQIQKVTRNILADYDYTLQLSDITAINVLNQTITDVIDHERVIENNRLRDYNKARRGWRTTEELRTMVYDPDGYFDAENIRPNSIDTNMLSVGAKSQQFILEGVILQANYNGVANAFNASSGTLVHLAVYDESSKKEIERSWNVSGIDYEMENSGGYYVFAKCSKIANTGVFIVTQTRYMVENTEDPNNYYFQVGIIGSLNDGFRDFTTTFGFTRINGNTITTGKIKSSGGGTTYFDLDNGEIGGNIKFISSDGSYKEAEQYINDTIGAIEIGGENLVQVENSDKWIVSSLTLNKIIFADNMPADDYVFSYNNLASLESRNVILLVQGVTGSTAVNVKNTILTKGISAKYNINLAQYAGTYNYFRFLVVIGAQTNSVTFTNIMLQSGTKATTYQRALKYISDAITNGSTEIQGGLLLTNLLFMKNLAGKVLAGISGMNDDNIAFFGGGDYEAALDDSANIILRKDGSAQFLGGLVKFTTDKKMIIDLENFKINNDGNVVLTGFFGSKFSNNYNKTSDAYPSTMNYVVDNNAAFNFVLPNTDVYIGSILTIYLAIDIDTSSGNSLTIGSNIDGGIVSYNGEGITMLARYKGTVIRLMATEFVNGRLQWEFINYNPNDFAKITISDVIKIIIDKSKYNADQNFDDLQEMVEYWNGI